MAESFRKTSEYNRRTAVIKGVRAERTPSEIVKFFGYPRSTVYDIVQRYAASEESEEGSCTPARKIHVREKAILTPELVKRAQDLISKDSRVSLAKLAAILGMSDTTVRRIVQEDLRYKSYVLKVRQMLSEAAKAKRLARCNLLVKDFWPPNSPDLNPLDYYVWGVVERVINKARHPNVASLQAAIEAAFMKMDRAQLQRACSRFRNRIEAVIEAQGGYIE
ncbi:uncharacterized protein [Mycetomoellerius zeteki]|uniref:uncharacterized protein n=1 Tax=Mycetomoellerius zeteki TaxID=64791 RepID=UPI00084E6D10|nr:PREDICTED: uncharacterized protein LOC108727992 [Trachymyrmex zeteki]